MGTKKISVIGSHLKTGHTKSCGCLNKEIITIHGLNKTTEYNSWKGFINRCYNKTNKNFINYGKRGIGVCKRWRDSINGVKNFIQDMGSKPGPEYSIDRIDNNWHYEPSNCRWTTITEQNRNMRSNKIKDIQEANYIRDLYNNGVYSQKELAKLYNCSTGTISLLINNKTWK